MTQVISPFASRMGRMARVLPEWRKGLKELTSEQKRQARHLAWDGFTDEEIRQALGVDMSLDVFRRRLRAINVRRAKGVRVKP